MKKLATLLFAAMLAGQAWAEDFTVGDLKYTITGATTVSVGAVNKDITGNIDIPAEVENDGVTYTVTSVGEYAFSGADGLDTVVIPNTVEIIDDHAFFSCENLDSVNIPNSVTTIGGGAFYGCDNLTTLSIPNSVTLIKNQAFGACEKLIEINVASDNSLYSSEDGVLFNKDKTVLICFPSGKSGEYSIPNSVVVISGAAFENNSVLKSVSIPNSVTIIGQGAFSNCFCLATVDIAEGVETIEHGAFGNCYWLESITIPSTVKKMSYGSFYGAGLTHINVASGNPNYSSVDGVVFNKNKTELICCPAGREGEYSIPSSVTIIGKNAFYRCIHLDSVTIPESVTSIEEGAFEECSFKNITIPNSVTSIGQMAFAYTSSLKSVILPESINSIGLNAFMKCNNLVYNEYDNGCYLGTADNPYYALIKAKSTDITSCEINSSCKLIADYAFKGCTNLASLSISGSQIKIGDNAFQGCNGLQYNEFDNGIYLGNNDNPYVLLIQTKSTDITSFEIHNGCTGISNEVFKNCTKLTSVTFPNTLTTIGDNAFENCTGLVSVKIPNSVTTIGNKAYYNCTGLQWILIPNSVTNVGSVQFLYCDNLTIFCEAESKPEGWDDAWNSARSPVIWGFDTSLEIYIVTVAANNKNYGSVAGGGAVAEDSVVTISATPANDYRFVSWNNGSTNATETITVTSDTSLVAEFAKIKYYDVTVRADDSEHGTVAGGGNFAEGSEVTISAKPEADYKFVRWSNGQTNDTITITVNSNISLVAEFAEKDLHYEITSDSTVAVVKSDEYIWRTKITIPETVEIDGKTYTVTAIGSTAFEKCNYLKTVEIPNTVTSIYTRAFQQCSNLESVTLSDHLTKIGQLTFAQCSTLTNIIIPISVDTIDAYAFFECKNITIYCEAESKPAGWAAYWNSNRPVVWGYGAGPQNLQYEITSNNMVKVVRAKIYEMLTEIEIPETVEIDGTTYTVTAIGDAAFAYCSKLTSVVIPNTVTDIGNQAFMDCANLTSLRLPNSITSISQETFANSGLTSIDISRGVTSIERYAFSNCHLTSVAIPTTTTTIEYEAFGECDDLQTVIIPNSVTSIAEFAFVNCFNLTIYCEADTAPETWVYDWNFSQCPVVWGYSIRKEWTVSLSANNSAYGSVSGGATVWDGSRITIVATPVEGYRFVQWSNGLLTASATITVTSDLTLVAEFAEIVTSETWTVTLSTDNSAHGSVEGGGTYAHGSVVTITATPAPGYRFVRWSNDMTTATAHITVTSDITLVADFEPVTMYEISLSANNSAYGTVEGGGTFADGTTITITATPAEGYRFVQWSNGLTTATANIVVDWNMELMAVFTPEQTTVGYLQYEITSSTKVKVVKSDNYRYMTGIVIPETVEIDGSTYTVTEIGENAFKDCNNLSSVTIPNTVKTIENWAFYRCYGLKTITIPNSVERILYGAFEDCSGLESITIPEGVTYLDNCVFEGCDALTSITIPQSVTSISYGLFRYCDNLTTISLPNTIVEVNVSAFEGCNKLEYNEFDNALYLGNAENPYVVLIKAKSTDITDCEINSNCKVIAGAAFNDCKGLTSITVPNSVENIGYGAFSGCSSLESITLPFVGDKRHSFTDARQYPFGYIFGGSAYEGGVATTQSYYYYDYGGYVSSTYYIPSSLKSVVLTDCEYIQFDAFDDCDNLTSITIPTSVTQIESSAFGGCSDNLIIYCDLKSAPRGWNLYLDSYNIVWGDVDVIDANNVDGDFAYRIIDGTKAEIIDYVGSDSVIVIPSVITKNGIQYTVTRIGDNAFKSYREMQSVTIPNTVTSIGNRAFAKCYRLKSVDIPNSVTTIGSYTFEECSGLTLIEIPNSVTTFGKGAFYNCYNLTSVEIPNSVTSISNSLFSYCSNLNSVTIPSSVTSIGYYAFSSCRSLATVDIPNSVTNIEESAFNRSGLTHIAIPSSITRLNGWTFDDCKNLEALIVPNSVTSTDWIVVRDCPKLTVYCEADSMPEKWDSYWNPDSCPVVWGADINSIFYLAAVPNNSEYGSTEGSGAFTDGSLATITAKPAIGYRFEKWSNGLTNATATVTVTSNTTLVANFVRTGFTRDYYYFTSDSTVEFARLRDNNNMKEVVIPDTVEHYGKKYAVTSIDSWAFRDCDSLTSVTIPNTVTSIETGTFYGCSNLKSITIPGSVTSIGEWAFVDCTSLTDVTISEGVTSIGNLAFSGCIGLKSVTIPSTVTSIGGYAFDDCDSLTKAEFGSIESLCEIDFDYNNNPLRYAEHLYIDGVEVTDLVIPNTVTKIGSYTFYGCNSLTSVTISNSVTTIDEYAFYWCDSLKLVIVPASVASIGVAAFGKNGLKFYCEAESQPEGWNENWNLNDGSVVWNAGSNLEIFRVLAAADSAYGSVDCDGAVVGGYTTKITANPAKGYHFTAWNDGNTDNPRTLTVASDTSLTASFEAHTAVVDAAVEPTCTESGLTEGSHCSVCGEVIVAQKTIPAIGHEFVNYVYNNDATTTDDGTETAVCEHGCGATDTRVAEGTRLGTAVTESAASKVSIYAHHNIIVVENATDEIRVYDAMGKLICRDAIHRIRAEINVNGTGVYIVKTGGAVKRVIVN